MAPSTGRQYACTLETGDRHITTDLDRRHHEVTDSPITEHLDGSASAPCQSADPVSHAHHTYAAAVHVTYRAPRCPHGNEWRWVRARGQAARADHSLRPGRTGTVRLSLQTRKAPT
ncbi:hypothetical protein [Streptomyces sp. NPDC096013]|uniref:hypothetical protein n=1 Tax=Streptomyces sp. NPDC096013 TaxID=3366069 RepID=UPI003803248D